MNAYVWRYTFLLLGAVALLFGFNHAVYQKENLLKNGAVVKLKLAPRDPRSLMTGDYMVLNFDIANKLNRSEKIERDKAYDGFVVVNVSGKGVGEFASKSDVLPTLSSSQMALQYRYRDSQIKFATNAFFFQEGHAKAYEAAQYGEFRVSPKGELLLTHLLDQQLQRIKP